MIDDFLLRAVLAGIGLSVATGPLGSFVVWRRMAYFGDTVAHAAILGVAIALGFSASIFVGTLGVALAIGLLASALSVRGRAMDTTLGVLSHSALALGLVGVSFVHGVRIDLSAYLFGDILSVDVTQLWLIWGGALAVLAVLIWRWSALLTATLNDELAASAGIDPRRERVVLTVAMALVVALSLKVVGALLIGALLIIPAATARGFVRSPEAMAVLASVAGGLSTVLGIWASVLLDTPTGPSIVVAAAVLFAVSLVITRRQH
jgi:zinc transport system permease protein